MRLKVEDSRAEHLSIIRTHAPGVDKTRKVESRTQLLPFVCTGYVALHSTTQAPPTAGTDAGYGLSMKCLVRAAGPGYGTQGLQSTTERILVATVTRGRFYCYLA